MKITVTESDISNGNAGDEQRCPIALAFQRTAGLTDCSVSDRMVVFTWKKGLRYRSLPPKARHFIEDYDGGKTVKPFSFILPI